MAARGPARPAKLPCFMLLGFFYVNGIPGDLPGFLLSVDCSAICLTWFGETRTRSILRWGIWIVR